MLYTVRYNLAFCIEMVEGINDFLTRNVTIAYVFAGPMPVSVVVERVVDTSVE